MRLFLPVEEIEQYQDDYLWDDLVDQIRLLLWELGIRALSDWSDWSDSEDTTFDKENENEE